MDSGVARAMRELGNPTRRPCRRGYVLGLALYCGPQSRIQMNAVRPPFKTGSYDRLLNSQILLLLGLQAVLSVASAVISWDWRRRHGLRRPHLALDDPVQILYGYLVPISLFVTMELVKFWQAFVFINCDPALAEAPPPPSQPAAKQQPAAGRRPFAAAAPAACTCP
eukprot:XP_001700811.1 predicted protein [Chlamydomonas reinhardtii]